MRLYLSSYKLSRQPERLGELIGVDDPKVAVIANAGDIYTPQEQGEKFQEDLIMFKPFNFQLERLDLRDYFGKKDELEKKIAEFDCVWVRGGNTFVLRKAMRESGFDELIKHFLAKDILVYAGYSAGVVVLQKSLKGLDIVDDPNEVPPGYPAEIIWDGLGLLPYNVAVHYKSDHPESADVDKEIEYLEKNNLPYRTLQDGQAIVVDGDKEEFLK